MLRDQLKEGTQMKISDEESAAALWTIIGLVIVFLGFVLPWSIRIWKVALQ